MLDFRQLKLLHYWTQLEAKYICPLGYIHQVKFQLDTYFSLKSGYSDESTRIDRKFQISLFFFFRALTSEKIKRDQFSA